MKPVEGSNRLPMNCQLIHLHTRIELRRKLYIFLSKKMKSIFHCLFRKEVRHLMEVSHYRLNELINDCVKCKTHVFVKAMVSVKSARLQQVSLRKHQTKTIPERKLRLCNHLFRLHRKSRTVCTWNLKHKKNDNSPLDFIKQIESQISHKRLYYFMICLNDMHRI